MGSATSVERKPLAEWEAKDIAAALERDPLLQHYAAAAAEGAVDGPAAATCELAEAPEPRPC